MIREKLIDKGIGDNKKVRWRSHETSRIEGLSDGVFAFAVTLLGRRKLEVRGDCGAYAHRLELV